ncbi:MAG: heme-binding protein [Pseudoclavibacter sp.]
MSDKITDPGAFVSFTTDDAWRLGCMMREKARERGLPICVDITRPNGTTLFHASLPGATVDNDGWASRKAAVSHRFEVSSAEFGAQYEVAREHPLLAKWVDLDLYAPVGGAHPIFVAETLIAVVAVSGLPDTGDHDFIVECLKGVSE